MSGEAIWKGFSGLEVKERMKGAPELSETQSLFFFFLIFIYLFGCTGF